MTIYRFRINKDENGFWLYSEISEIETEEDIPVKENSVSIFSDEEKQSIFCLSKNRDILQAFFSGIYHGLKIHEDEIFTVLNKEGIDG